MGAGDLPGNQREAPEGLAAVDEVPGVDRLNLVHLVLPLPDEAGARLDEGR